MLFQPSDDDRRYALNGSRVAEVHLTDVRRLMIHHRGRIKRSAPTNRVVSSKLSNSVEFSVPVFAGVVVIATGEFDEHARLIADRPRIVPRWQQHHIIL
jgi:hypothetical protein